MALLGNLVLVLAFSVVIVLLAQRLHIPSMVGFLLAGIAAGPSALGLVSDVAAVEVLAEVGVVLLMFTLGMEFSVARLRALLRVAVVGGGAQVLFTVAGFALTAHFLWSFAWNSAIFVGFLMALSSTAIGIRVLRDRGEVESPHGTASLGILIFQDMAVVPMMLLIPVLSGQGGNVFVEVGFLLVKTVLVVAGVLFLSIRGVPFLLHAAARWRSSELFLLTLLSICFGVAWATHAAGLSLALGAFLAGLVISGSEYEQYAAAQISPLHDVFICFFFLSVGMSMDVHVAMAQPLAVLGLSAGLMVIKWLLVSFAALLPGLSFAAALITGGMLCQVGEFSFILAAQGKIAGLFTGEPVQIFMAAAVVSMIVTPFVGNWAAKLGRYLQRRGTAELREQPVHVGEPEVSDHLVIIGYGPAGRHLTQAAALWHIPHVIIESNPDTVRDERAKGVPILFGDASSEHMLKYAGVERARVVAVVVSDPVAAHTITAVVRRIVPDVQIITRARYLGEYDDMRAAGANSVVPAEMEASIAILWLVLERFMVGRDEAAAFLDRLRAEGYKMTAEDLEKHGRSGFLPFIQMRQTHVEVGSFVAEKSIGELNFRREYRVAIMALRHETEVLPLVKASTVLHTGDEVLLSGAPQDLDKALRLFVRAAGEASEAHKTNGASTEKDAGQSPYADNAGTEPTASL